MGMSQNDTPSVEGSPSQRVGRAASFPVGPTQSSGAAGDKLTRAATQQWGLALASDEKVLWGPCLFHEELLRWCRCPQRRRSKVTNLKSPTALVTITDRRLVIM